MAGDMWRVFLDRQLAWTAQPASEPLDLIIWPETAVPYLLEYSDDLFAEMAAVSGGVPIVTGAAGRRRALLQQPRRARRQGRGHRDA